MSNIETAKVAKPFQFYTRVSLRELTGLKAKNLQELLSHIQTVPDSVIYHHTHHFLQEHQYFSPEPPNDFAYWIKAVLNESALAERLASINTCEFSTIQALRNKISSTIENFLQNSKGALREANDDESLHFIKSVSVVFPTPYRVNTLEEFADVLKKITMHSIYFHVFEAKLRLAKGSNDFSVWLEASLDEKELARKIEKLDPYTFTMEGLRNKILGFVENRIGERGLEWKP